MPTQESTARGYREPKYLDPSRRHVKFVPVAWCSDCLAANFHRADCATRGCK